MFRKIILGFGLFILLTSNIFAICNYCQTYCEVENRVPAFLFIGTKDNIPQKQVIANKYHKNNKILCSENLDSEVFKSTLDKYGLCSSDACLGAKKKITDAVNELTLMSNNASAKEAEITEQAKIEAAKNNVAGKDFEISTSELLGDNELKDENSIAKNTINTTLGTVIQKLMIALGSISLLIMTIGAGYMIMYSGHDELLSKGKSIFNAGIISLVVALLSYYMVSLLKFILYA